MLSLLIDGSLRPQLWPHNLTIVIITLGWGLFVGLAAESCGRIWLLCLYKSASKLTKVSSVTLKWHHTNAFDSGLHSVVHIFIWHQTATRYKGLILFLSALWQMAFLYQLANATAITSGIIFLCLCGFLASWYSRNRGCSQRGAGGLSPLRQKPSPLESPNEMTLCTGVFMKSRHFESRSPPPPSLTLASPSFWKV